MIFFDETLRTFQRFSPTHWVAITTVIFGVVLIFMFHRRISTHLDSVIRRGAVIWMLGMEATYYVWALNMAEGMNVIASLHIGVCAVALYVTCIALWTKNETLFTFIFPWAILGALFSIGFATIIHEFPHFRFMHYFGNHSLFLLGNLYLLKVHKFKFNYRNLLVSYIGLAVFAVIMYPINIAIEANNLFLRELPPEVAPFFTVFGRFWIFGLALAIFWLFNLVYLPFIIKDWINKGRRRPKETII